MFDASRGSFKKVFCPVNRNHGTIYFMKYNNQEEDEHGWRMLL